MPIRLDTVLKEVEHMSNRVNSDLLKDFYQHMKDNGTSQNYQKGNLKAMVHLSVFILADAIALVLVGSDNRTSKCLLFRHSYMLYHIPDDSITTLVLLLG
jgi:hypothetical protein